MSAPGWFDRLSRDVSHALRAIARAPLVATVIVASLGVAIGVNTVVFSWMRAVLFEPLPSVQGSATLWLVEPRSDSGGYPGASWAEYKDLQAALGAFEDLIACRMVALYLGDEGRVERVYGLLVSGNYFDALRLRPVQGRFITAEDTARTGGAPVAVISHDYWTSQLARDPAAVGRVLRINNRAVTIVGVAPEGFQGTTIGLAYDLWLPATMAPEVLVGSRELENRAVRGYSLIGRLRGGVAHAQAQVDVDAAMRRLAADYPLTNAPIRGEVLAITDAPRGPQRFLVTALSVLQGLMLLLLLAVCGNTANLVLARASARQRETGIRLALGARPWSIARLLLIENLVLGCLGAMVGVLFAYWGAGSLRAIPPLRGLPIRFQTDVDTAALVLAAGLGMLGGLLFGAAPALQLCRADPQAALHGGARSAGRSRLRQGLMATQVALAMVVLVVSALFLRSFLDTRAADTGFRRDGVLLAAYDLTGRGMSPESSRQFVTSLLERLRAVPGIQAAAVAASVPLDIHGLPSRRVIIEGRGRNDVSPDEALVNTVTPGYFQVMGIPIRSGSDFASLAVGDTASAPAQAIVNEAFVQRYLEGREPLGRRIELARRSFAINGVVRDSLYNAFGEPSTPIVYLPFTDNPSQAAEIHVLTAPGAEGRVTADVRRAVAQLAGGLPIYNVRTMGEHIESNLVFRRIPARLFSFLGPLILFLVSIGIYAVVSYAVALQTREIGVRMALGATPRRVMVQIAGEHLSICAVGMMAGWLVAFAATLDLTAGGPGDVVVFGGVPAVLMLTAAFACWAAVRRASTVDPLVALRQE